MFRPRSRHNAEELEDDKSKKPLRDNNENFVAYLLKIADYVVSNYVKNEGSSFIELKFNPIDRKTLDYIVRTLYEFQDAKYYRDLKIISLDVKMLLAGRFVMIKHQTMEDVFTLLYNLYEALINDSKKSIDYVENVIENEDYYQQEEISMTDALNHNSVIWIRFNLDNSGNKKDVDERLEDDYKSDPHRLGSALLPPMDDVEGNMQTDDVKRDEDKRKRREEFEYGLYEDTLDPLRGMEGEYDFELRYQEALRNASNLESVRPSTSNTYNVGEGILKQRQKLNKKLYSYFIYSPFKIFNKH